MPIPDIVLDTNVVIAAQRSQRGASAKLMSLLGTGRYEIHLSVAVVLEYEEVLRRQSDELALSYLDVMDLVDALCALGQLHKIYYLWRPQLSDAKDEFILELAVTAGCSHIVTYNERDFSGVEQFGIKIVTPKELLEEIGVLK